MKNIVYDIPNGPVNLSNLFPDIDWSNVESYEVSVLSENDVVMAKFHNEFGCCCEDDGKVRIHFVNYLGRIDSINFNHKEETYEPKSDTWQKSLSFTLKKSDGGFQRFNIKSNETYKATTLCYGEDDIEWVKELLGSPSTWIEWKGTEGQVDDYIPVTITDKKVITRKKEGRYFYEIVVEYSMSNENIHLRS